MKWYLAVSAVLLLSWLVTTLFCHCVLFAFQTARARAYFRCNRE